MSAWSFPLPRIFWFLLFIPSIPSPTLAGHGFASAFSTIEWLPDPGRTPDSIWYQLDSLREESQLFFARTPTAKIPLCLTFAREKLAELEAMVKVENAMAAEAAANQYRLYIDRAQQLITNDDINKESLAENMANALLEHQYILSVVYEELPASTRSVVLQVTSEAHERYQDVTRLLPPKKKGALFFKEEEVRWSVQMAMRADENTSSPR